MTQSKKKGGGALNGILVNTKSVPKRNAHCSTHTQRLASQSLSDYSGASHKKNETRGGRWRAAQAFIGPDCRGEEGGEVCVGRTCDTSTRNVTKNNDTAVFRFGFFVFTRASEFSI